MRDSVKILALGLLFASVNVPGPEGGEPTMAGVRLAFGPSSAGAQADRIALSGALKTIDMAAYVLTDRDIIGELDAAAARGVRVRIYLDATELRALSSAEHDRLVGLARRSNVTLRSKAPGAEPMHFKAYAIDGRMLRTGSANFSHSGLHMQDNDVLLIDSPLLAAAFARTFEEMWARSSNREFSP